MIALNATGPNPFGNILSSYDLLIFSIGAFVLISILFWYYNQIPSSNNSINELDNPIYQSTDVLLQSKSNDSSFVIAKKSTSIFVKALVLILVSIVLFTPFQKLLSISMYLY